MNEEKEVNPDKNKPIDILLYELKNTFANEKQIGKTLPDAIKKVVGNYVGRIRERRITIKQKQNEARAELTARIKILELELKELQTNCPHINTKYHPDASGNNDSEDECLDCGKSAKYLDRD